MKALNKRLHRIAATHESVSLDVGLRMKQETIMPINEKDAPISVFVAASLQPARGNYQLIDAESFTDIGGWVVDQQSMDQMPS